MEPFTPDDLLRHHFAYEAAPVRPFFERILRRAALAPARIMAHAGKLFATGMNENLESGARLLLDLGDVPAALLEEGLAGQDAVLHIELILRLRRGGRRFHDPEIEDYIVNHDRSDERFHMAERFAAETGGGEGIYRTLFRTVGDADLPELAQSLVRAEKIALCGELKRTVEARTARVTPDLVFASATLGCPTALAALDRLAAQAAGHPEDPWLSRFLDFLIRIGPARIPGEVVARATGPLVDATSAGERLRLLLAIAALRPEATLQPLALKHCGDPSSPDLALPAALATGAPVDPANLPAASARTRMVSYAVLGSACVAEAATAARLLDFERDADPGLFARVADLVAAGWVASPPDPLIDFAANHFAGGPLAASPAEASADLAALLLSAGRLERAAVRRMLAVLREGEPPVPARMSHA